MHLKVTRRKFIQISGVAAAGLATSGLGFDLSPIRAHTQMLKTATNLKRDIFRRFDSMSISPSSKNKSLITD